MVQRLSHRLECVFQWVPQDAKVVDVGTDHALLPIALVERGVATRMIASDIVQGPLDAARSHVEAAALLDKIDLRLGPGLSTVRPGEVDTAIIAGMGGGTIAEILSADKEVTKLLKTLVVQPMNAPARLRSALRDLEFFIEDEQYLKDKDRVYQLILARPDPDGLHVQDQYDRFVQLGLEWLALEFGPVNLSQERDGLVRGSLEAERAHLYSILNSMDEKGLSQEDERRAGLRQQLQQIESWLSLSQTEDRG